MAIDNFVYTVADDWGQRTATVTVNVESGATGFVNAIDDAVSTLPGTAVVISPLVNDQFSAGLGPLHVMPGSVTTPAPAGSGNAVIQPNATDILYTPTGGFQGEATFSYDARSNINTAIRDTGLIRVTVTPTPVQTGQYPIPLPGQIYTVTTQAEFDARLNISKPGDEIIVKCNLTALGPVRSGSQAHPIVIRGEPNQAWTINGNVNFNGNDIQICQFKIADTRRVFMFGTRNRLHRCRVKYSGGAGITCSASSRSALISYCEIDGALVTPTTTSWPGINLQTTAFGPQNNVVRRCWMHTCVFTGDRDCSAFFLGTTQDHTDHNTGNIIEDVLIEDWLGDGETIANKSSNNTYRYVTIVNSNEFSNRHGNNNVYWGCWSQGSKGWDVFDANNSLLGCQVSGGGTFHISNGQVTAAGWPGNAGNPPNANHPQAADTIVAGCFGTLQLGLASAPVAYDEPALRTIIERHTVGGNILVTAPNGMHTGTIVRTTITAGRAVPVPIQITQAMVGVTAQWFG